MRVLLILSICALILPSLKPKPAYQIFYGKKAKAIDYGKMIKGLAEADVVFFGETHNHSISHWLQLQVLKSMVEELGKEVVVGAEMLEADDQLILDEYLTGLIKESHFLKEAKIWDNYSTDYAPIVNYAKKYNHKVVATNIPRRYASMVARNGFEGLAKIDPEAKKYMAPLPIDVPYELSSYKEMSGMMGPHGGSTNMIDAQASKDATMAYFISKNISEGSVFFHINGSFHSKNGEGIVYYLKKQMPALNIVTITGIEQKDINELEEDNKGIADYVIAIPSDMTKTY